MPSTTIRPVPPFVLEAMAASQVGTWKYDVTSGVMCGDANMARLFGHGVEEAEAGLPFQTFCRAVDREDDARAEILRARLRERGGALLIAMRVKPGPGLERRLMIRGAFERDAAGGMRGRGVAIDVTGSELDGGIEGGSVIMAEPSEGLSPLDDVARHAIAAHNAVNRLDERDRLTVQPPANDLLMTIGRAIARRLGLSRGSR